MPKFTPIVDLNHNAENHPMIRHNNSPFSILLQTQEWGVGELFPCKTLHHLFFDRRHTVGPGLLHHWSFVASRTCLRSSLPFCLFQSAHLYVNNDDCKGNKLDLLDLMEWLCLYSYLPCGSAWQDCKILSASCLDFTVTLQALSVDVLGWEE